MTTILIYNGCMMKKYPEDIDDYNTRTLENVRSYQEDNDTDELVVCCKDGEVKYHLNEIGCYMIYDEKNVPKEGSLLIKGKQIEFLDKKTVDEKIKNGEDITLRPPDYAINFEEAKSCVPGISVVVKDFYMERK